MIMKAVETTSAHLQPPTPRPLAGENGTRQSPCRSWKLVCSHLGGDCRALGAQIWSVRGTQAVGEHVPLILETPCPAVVRGWSDEAV